MLPWNIDEEFAQKVRDGSVAYDLLRPVDLYAFWYSHTLAYRMPRPPSGPSLWGSWPSWCSATLGLAEWALRAPPSWASGVLFGVSLCGRRGVVYRHYDAVAHLLAVDHLRRRHRPAHRRWSPCAGMVIPLPLFPDWDNPSHWQPFRGLVDVPFRIYSGNIPPTVALLEIVSQGYGWDVSCGLGRVCSRGTRNGRPGRVESWPSVSLKLYWLYVKLSVRAQLQYRAAFLLAALGQFLVTGIEFLGVWAFFDRFGRLHSWSLPEVAVFYGLVIVPCLC